MKRVLLIGIVLFCAQWVSAQKTPCEKMFSNAEKYYNQGDYANAKVQFQKVVNNCDSNKEIAQQYIALCNGWIRLQEKEMKNSNSFDRDPRIKNLEDAKDKLEKEKATLVQRKKKIEEDNKTLVDQCQIKDATIDQLNDSITNKLLPLIGANESLESSLRMMGDELNAYLKQKVKRRKKDQIMDYDTITDRTSLRVAMRNNLKILTDK